jgi:hypothetical protein
VSAAAPELVRPAHLWVPPHISTAGRDAAELAAMAGLQLDAEQVLALETVLAEREGGRWAALEAAIIEARQNGKTVDLQAIVLYLLFVIDVRLAIWTAHLFPTAQEAFRDLDGIIAGTPEFSRRVKRVSRANGEEGFEFHGDRRLNFRARSKTGGRGLTGDVVILDEAFALTPSEMGSLLPTLSARPNPLVVYASSAGLVSSDLLRTIRDRGRRGDDPSLAYIEWCAKEGDCADDQCTHRPGTDGCILDDEDRWAEANHTLGRRISIDNIRAERRALPPEEFARERLGWWDEPALGGGGIPPEVWAACANRDATIAEPCALAFDVAPGHLSASVVTCGGALHVTEHRYGTAWIPDRLAELAEAHQLVGIGFDPASPAGALIPDLEKAGFVIRSPKTPKGQLVPVEGREAVQACESFLAATIGRQLVHRDETALNLAVAGAVRRQSGDSWKWSRRDSSVDISPLVAATQAKWLDDQNRPERYRGPLVAFR